VAATGYRAAKAATFCWAAAAVTGSMAAGENGILQYSSGIIVMSDMTGDGVADLVFALASASTLSEADFVL
jgi:hypothetical protein